jgi:hypothetical protein
MLGQDLAISGAGELHAAIGVDDEGLSRRLSVDIQLPSAGTIRRGQAACDYGCVRRVRSISRCDPLRLCDEDWESRTNIDEH